LNQLSSLRKYFIYFTLLIYSGGLIALSNGFNSEEDDGGLYFIGLIISSLFIISTINLSLIKIIGKFKLLLLITVLNFASVIWSSEPNLTLIRATLLLLTFTFAVYLSVRFSLQNFLEFLSNTLYILIIGSIFVILLTNHGIMDDTQNHGLHEGSWKGLFIHKNKFGKIVSLMIILSLFLYSETKNKKHLFLIVVGVFLLTKINSSSALIITVVSTILFLYSRILLKSKKITLLIILCLALIINFSDLSFIFELLGKESNLTGRLPLWGSIYSEILKKPLLGYGYEVFWVANKNRQDLLGWDSIQQAHNGYLEVALNTGLIGLVLLIFLLYKYFTIVYKYSKKIGSSLMTKSSFIYFLYFLIYNFSESTSVKHFDLFWLLFMFFFIKIISNQEIKFQNAT
jgi:exopolysaccharide production protein ExoQ